MKRQKGKEPLRAAIARLDKRLWHQIEEVWNLAQIGIHDYQRSKEGHQQGTPHCLAVEQNLAALITDDWKGTRLTSLDLFTLSAAAALHDVGKASDSSDDHGHVSMWEVRERATVFGLDQGQAEIVGWIVRAHNDGNLEALPSEPVPLGTADVDLRPLAALFKLADTLHTDYCRISPQVVEFGGRQVADNPKTRFRLRVRGWRFDDHDRIELYAVLKDWDDLEVIHTGFEMICRELEPVIPVLRYGDLPWELRLHLDETDLERRAISELEAQITVERAFVGMNHFTEADVARFKGRDDDVQVLWRRVMATPITLLVGNSGVGKTSLIQAGLFPIAHRANWRTAYARPLDEPDRSILRDLLREMPELGRQVPVGLTILEVLEQACRLQPSYRLLVVLDQFEDVLHVPLPEMLNGLQRALVAVLAERLCNLRLLVSYRSDVEAQIGPLFQELAGSTRGLPRVYLQPLGTTGARAALKAGFEAAQLGVTDSLLDNITRDLAMQFGQSLVYPPYVQMVGETLCQAAREEEATSVSEGTYQTRGGCEAIVGHYLLRRLAEFGEREDAARRVLVALVRSTGSRGQQSTNELAMATRLVKEQLHLLLDELVHKRMVRKLDGEQYEIIHDHLAGLVNQKLIGTQERQFKQLWELLDLKTRAYGTSHALLESSDMTRLYAVRREILPTEEQLRLLLHSCLLDRGPAWFWFRSTSRDNIVALLQEALAAPVASLRQRAVTMLVQMSGREAISNLRGLLKDPSTEVRRTAAKEFAKVAEQEDMVNVQELLKDQDIEIRRAAVKALARIGEQEVIPELRRMLKDARGEIRLTALRALADIVGNASIADLRLMLKDQRPEVRLAAVRTLARVGGRETIPDLRLMLKDQRSEVRLAAVKALTQVGGSEVVSDLQELLADENTQIRRATVKALARQAGQNWQQNADLEQLAVQTFREGTRRSDAITLLGLLDERRVNVRGAALKMLASLAGKDAIPYLRQSLMDQSDYVRTVALEMLSPVVEREDIPALLKFLGVNGRRWRSRGSNTRRIAMQALSRVVDRNEIPDLIEVLKDKDREVRQLAARTIARAAGQEDIPVLQLLLKDPHAYVRGAAAEVLFRVAGKGAILDIQQLLADESPYVRQTVAQILVDEEGEEGIPDLLKLLKDRSAYVRRTAARALAQAAGDNAIIPLQDLMRDESPHVRQAVAEVLGQVIGKTAIPQLQELLKDQFLNVRQAAAHELENLVTQDCLSELADWAARYTLDDASELASRVLIHLDRRFYCPV